MARRSASAFLAVYAALGSAAGSNSAATNSRPLAPAPKPRVMMSKARRWVDDVGQAPTSSWPRISVSVGAASGSRTASAATSDTHGWRVTSPAQRAHMLWLRTARVAPRRSGTRSASIRRPTRPRTAGRNVIDVSTATSTATADA